MWWPKSNNKRLIYQTWQTLCFRLSNIMLQFVHHCASVCAIWQPFIKLTWTPPCLNPCPVFQLCPVCVCLSLREKNEPARRRDDSQEVLLCILAWLASYISNMIGKISYQSLGKWWDVISTDQKLRVCQSRQRNSCGKYIKCIFVVFTVARTASTACFFSSVKEFHKYINSSVSFFFLHFSNKVHG